MFPKPRAKPLNTRMAESGGVEELDNLKELLYPRLDFAELISKLTFYFIGCGCVLDSCPGAAFNEPISKLLDSL